MRLKSEFRIKENPEPFYRFFGIGRLYPERPYIYWVVPNGPSSVEVLQLVFA